jgi:hypothetical protein
MNKRLRTVGWRMLKRHPRQAVSVARFAGRHRKTLADVLESGQQASRLAATVKQAVMNRKVQAEARSMVSSLSHAVRRARHIGMANGLGDKQLAGHVRQAVTHASMALAAARHPRPRKSFLGRAAAITAGIGTLGGAVYTQRKARTPGSVAGHADPT